MEREEQKSSRTKIHTNFSKMDSKDFKSVETLL